ncbi:MAG TPA: tRNA (adenosine(37)-N6)-threonylcarbamoyltransferase complex dimerization subunit type 1 TsaB [Gillisia sp.]|nr:tRNA (adenosine(37)-N6)-threonylcarbamoyltransferase complex dimerization subunit type 1 TsaB [Gillisia sp.]
MANILCIETATTNCSISLGVDGKLKSLKEENDLNYSHSERLHVLINDILEESGIKLSELDAIAISKGPGSYTGLRIGVSAAKGLCFSLDIPLISVPTLTSLAYKVNDPGYIVTMLDARRMEVYSAVFDQDKIQVEETTAVILDNQSYLSLLNNGKVNFIGSGVEKFRNICDHPNARFIENELPSSGEMINLATQKYQNRQFEDVAYFEPYYLKDFMAG